MVIVVKQNAIVMEKLSSWRKKEREREGEGEGEGEIWSTA